MASLSQEQGGGSTTSQSDALVETIWQMALASFAANNNQIVLPLGYEKSLPSSAIEELKARLSRHIGIQAFTIVDPAKSAFRILGLNAAAVEGIRQLTQSNVSLDSLVAQGNQNIGAMSSCDNDVVPQQAGGDNEKRGKIPRPPNAFILYRQHYHPTIKAENPSFHNNDISKFLGKQWKEESLTVRQIYKAQALERKAEHMKMYPDYQYAPRKPGEKKRRASRKDMNADAAKEHYDSPRFIDQEGDFFTDSDLGSGAGDDDMDVVGTNFDEGVRSFHYDGDGNMGIVMPATSVAEFSNMVEAHNARAQEAGGATAFGPLNDVQVTTSIPPHVQNDTDLFEALIDWNGIAEDFRIVQRVSGEDRAGLGNIETANPYLSLSDEDQRALFEAELERTLKFFD